MSKKRKIKIRPKSKKALSTRKITLKKTAKENKLLTFFQRIPRYFRYKQSLLPTALIGLVSIIILILYFRVRGKSLAEDGQQNEMVIDNETSEDVTNVFDKTDYTLLQEDLIERDIDLETFLKNNDISATLIVKLLPEAYDKGVTKLKAQRGYATFLIEGESPSKKYFQYSMNDSTDAIIRFHPTVGIDLQRKEYEKNIQAIGGIIKNDFLRTVLDRGIHYEMVSKMEDALKWSVDLFHVKLNDRFKVIYEEKKVDGKVIGTGNLLAVYFKTAGKEYYLFYMDGIEKPGFFDENARSVRRSFLKAPVKFARITSRYNLERMHPVKNKIIPHKGTDYGGNEGDPIFTVASGTVTIARRTDRDNNGKYVKIQHDNRYQTQYLHMSRLAAGIRMGTKVEQGEVIGYIGDTGLAKGYHVCFRFWKDGKQVDHTQEDFDAPYRLSARERGSFLKRKLYLQKLLDETKYLD